MEQPNSRETKAFFENAASKGSNTENTKPGNIRTYDYYEIIKMYSV